LAAVTDTAVAPPTVRDVVGALDARYPHAWAEQWDRVGLVLGEFDTPVRRVSAWSTACPQTVEEAVAVGADLIVATTRCCSRASPRSPRTPTRAASCTG
jgi:hypothetical protein